MENRYILWYSQTIQCYRIFQMNDLDLHKDMYKYKNINTGQK